MARTLVLVGMVVLESFIALLFFGMIFPRRRSVLLTVLIGFGLLLPHLVVFVFAESIALNNVSQIAVYLAIVLVCFHAKRVKAVVASLTFIALIVLTEWIVMAVLNVLTGEVFDAYLTDVRTVALASLIAKTLLLLVSMITARLFNIGANAPVRTPAFLIVLPAAAIFIDITFWRVLLLPSVPPAVQMMVVAGSLILIVSVMLTYVFYGSARRRSLQLLRTEESLRQAKAHIGTQVEHYDVLYRYQTETRKMHHDEKNKLLALSGLLQAGETEKAKAMLDREIAATVQKEETVVDTGNPVIDAVLQSKQNTAREHDVSMRVCVQTEEPIRIDAMQLSVLLGNAVDNAVEAVRKIDDPAVDRTVCITLQTRMGRILVSAENPTVEESGDVEHLHTGKDDPLHHGFGLQSIRTIASEHDGTVSLSWENHTFRIEIGLDNGDCQTPD